MKPKIEKSYYKTTDMWYMLLTYKIEIGCNFIMKQFKYYDKLTIDFTKNKDKVLTIETVINPKWIETNIKEYDKHFYETYLSILDTFIENDIKENILTRVKQ